MNESENPAPETEKPLHVLVVEDDPDIGILSRLTLQKAGYTVALATDAVKALDLIEEAAPDLVVLDVMLPDTSGFELLEQLRTRPELDSVPMMMMSAVSEDSYLAEGQRLGAEYYLKKPFLPSQLLVAVKGVFATAQRRRQALESKK